MITYMQFHLQLVSFSTAPRGRQSPQLYLVYWNNTFSMLMLFEHDVWSVYFLSLWGHDELDGHSMLPHREHSHECQTWNSTSLVLLVKGLSREVHFCLSWWNLPNHTAGIWQGERVSSYFKHNFYSELFIGVLYKYKTMANLKYIFICIRYGTLCHVLLLFSLSLLFY